MTITTNEVPTKGGTIEDALAQARAESEQPKPAAVSDQVRPERKPTKYLVVEELDEGTLAIVGVYEVTQGQPAARLAAIEANDDLRARVVRGDEVKLAAIANYNPVVPRLENRDPRIVA